MIICICHRVSDRDIARAARDGCRCFDELQDELAVATACGSCLDCARQTFDQHRDPVAAASGAACPPHPAVPTARPLPLRPAQPLLSAA